MFGVLKIGKLGASMKRAGFNPRYLFTKYSGVPASWYDPSDMSTLFQDAAGTVPVTAVEQPVGLQLDKSGRGYHRSQTTATKRPTLSRRYNQLIGTAALATQSVTVFAGSYTLAFSGAGSIALTGAATGTIPAGSTTITCTAGTLTLTVTGTVTDASLLIAADASLPYQRVTTASNYDADPSQFPAYLRLDGVDDAMVTAVQPWSTTSAVTVSAALQRFDTAAGSITFETGAGVTAGGRGWLGYSPFDSPKANSGFFSTGNANFQASQVTTGTSYKGVLTHRANILTPSNQSRFNGVPGTAVTTTQGAGPYANNSINWFARNQTANYFKGRAFGEIVIGAQLQDDEVALIEKYLAMKAGVTL